MSIGSREVQAAQAVREAQKVPLQAQAPLQVQAKRRFLQNSVPIRVRALVHLPRPDIVTAVFAQEPMQEEPQAAELCRKPIIQ